MRPPLLAALLLASAGCRSIIGLEDPVDTLDAAALDADGTADALPPDALGWCFDQGLQVCLTTPPGPPLVLTADIATATDSACTEVVTRAPAPDLCVLFRESITVPAGLTLRASGGRPIVLAATGAITIDGTVTVAASSLGVAAGANNVGCTFKRSPSASTGGSGGGAGGTFGTAGGDGGFGSQLFAQEGAASAAVAIGPDDVRGGCRGQVGAGPGPGDGGDSGGAVWIVSQSEITVTAAGRVLAGGAGGGGGTLTNGGCGGGGGGSGGLIGLGAPLVSVSGTLAANGGGGGGGGGAMGGGQQGSAAANTTVRASGGNGGNGAGGDGGRGGVANVTPQNGGGAGDGGGGGGGAAGVIWVIGTMVSTPTGSVITPAPSSVP